MPLDRAAVIRELLARKNVAAVAAIALGTVSGLVGGMVSAMGDGNYTHNAFLGGMAAAVGLAGTLFTVGAYVGAAAPWALTPSERDYSPGLATVGAIAGATVGSAAMLVPITVLGGAFGAVMGSIGVMPITLLAAAGGARLAMRPEWRKPAGAPRRWVRLVVAGALGLAAIVYGVWPHHTFPGAGAPVEARRAWAVSTFGEDYKAAEAYVKRSKVVRNRLGTVTAIAPTEGPNHTDQTPGELVGIFTLEVVGAKGRGTAEVSFVNEQPPTSFKGSLKTNGSETPLEN